MHSSNSIKPHLLQIAKHFDQIQDFAPAEKYYMMAGRPQDAVDMYTKSNKWEKAHSIATTYMSQDEVAELYISHARDMESQNRLKDAEKLYLTVGEPDLAINMYKNHKQYEHMIRLVTVHHKDLLVETHLYLARTLEAEANLRQAEHHYLEGKDWKSAINMYCANNMYEEGYRVAKAHGGQSSSKQVAYLWARSLGGEAAVKLLNKFNLLEVAIEFATENSAFEFAFELSRFSSDKNKLAEVHYKHAMFLEDEGKFKDAENAFILAGKPKEAILMYIHNETWDDAIKVAEQYEPSSVAEVLTSQAKISFDKKEYSKVEALMLRAQRPDLAINLYKSAAMWKEAIKFAKEYLPSKLPEVHEEYERYTASSHTKEDLLTSARMLEKQKEYAKAVETYLRMGPPMISDSSVLEQSWVRAVELASKFVGGERAKEVNLAAGAKLKALGKYDAAADVFTSGENFKEAIDACIMGNLWKKARHLTVSAPKLVDYVENAYMSHLKSDGQAEKLVSMDVSAGLDVYIQRGEWQKCLETAQSQVKHYNSSFPLYFSL